MGGNSHTLVTGSRDSCGSHDRGRKKFPKQPNSSTMDLRSMGGRNIRNSEQKGRNMEERRKSRGRLLFPLHLHCTPHPCRGSRNRNFHKHQNPRLQTPIREVAVEKRMEMMDGIQQGKEKN